MATKRPLVNNAGTLNEIATGDTLLASGFSIPSGTSTQFLKADGTADNTTYTVNSEVTRASIRPSLLLDFANSKTLDPRITFTRNSTASYYGKDGLLKTAAINSPRFDHNPTTGESLGLLIEEQRTNLLLYSDTLSTQSVTTTATSYTLSFYGTGTITLSGTYSGSLVGSGSYPTRSTLTFTPTAGTLTLTVTGSVTYAQLEAGAFATSYIPSTDTFTSRATTGTYIGSNGLIQTAAINTARYNYNPLNLALSPKLLLESASTNLLTYSEQFDNAAWIKYNSTITANATTAPDGTVTADKLIQNTANTTHLVKQGATTTNSSPLTGTVYVKAAESTNVTIQIQENTSFARYAFCTINLIAGTLGIVTVAGGAGSASASCTPVGNGWYRCSITVTLGGTDTNAQLVIFDGTSINVYTGDGTSGIYIWGAQLETGTSATSYITTTTAQVTRAADISSSAQSTRIADSAVMTGTNFSSWYRQDEGTVFVKYKYENPTNSTGLYPCTIDINDGTTNNNITQLTQSSSNFETFGVRSNSAAMADLYSSQAISTTSSNIVAGAYQSNSFASCLNGLSPQTDSSGNVPVNVNQMNIGNRIGYSWLNGRIAKLAYYPKRLTNTELQALTIL